MKMIISIVVILTLIVSSRVLTANFEIEGRYDCKWFNTETGKTVKGVMTIKKNGKTFTMKSHYDDETSYIGTGLYSQNKKNYVMGFYNPKNPEEVGVTVVELKGNSISSTWLWSYLNTQTVEHTTCIRRKLNSWKF